jgi:hypothetical protein
MALSNAALEAAANAVAALGAYISLHTADPGTTGASEAAYGGYVRILTTWTAGGSDGINTGSAITFLSVAAGTYLGMGQWSAVTAGTYVAGKTFPSIVLSGVANITLTPRVTVIDA